MKRFFGKFSYPEEKKLLSLFQIKTTSYHLPCPGSEKGNGGFSLATRNLSKAKPRCGWEMNGMGREGTLSPVFLSPELLILIVICLCLFGSCLCRSKHLGSGTISVYLVCMTPLSERESAWVVCQPMLMIRVTPASLPPPPPVGETLTLLFIYFFLRRKKTKQMWTWHSH